MRKSTRNSMIIGAVVVALMAATVLGISFWTRTGAARSSLLGEYLRAKSEGDKSGVAAFVAAGFVDEFEDIRLEPGAFRVWSFSQGEERESQALRFVLVAEGERNQAAWLGDAFYVRDGISLRLASLRMVGEGKPIVK